MTPPPVKSQAHPVYGWLTEQEYKAMLNAPYGHASRYRKLSEKRAKEAKKTKKK